MLKKLLLPLLGLFYLNSQAQTILDQKLDGTEQGKNLSAFLSEFESRHPVRFYYLPEWTDKIVFEQNFKDQPLGAVLDELFLGTELNYFLLNPNSVVFVKDPKQDLKRSSLINTAIQGRKKIEQLTLGNPATFKKGQKVIVRGKVTDSKNNEPLVGASIVVSDLQLVAITDPKGEYQVQLPTGQHVLSVSYVNYEEKVVEFGAYETGAVNIVLEETPTLLEEVIISDKAAREITTSRINITQLSIKEIKRAPALFGEVDLIRQIQILPGVTTSGEAASGFNVRGGGVDQNLILYDGLPVFNSSHVFGFFSAFNAEAVRDVTFYRGGIPAEFGGRVSSVLDIVSKEGNFEKWTGAGGIGIISSNALVSGPIVKDKTSIVASVRATYSDWFINSIRTNYVDLRKSKVFFYDGTMKLTHRFSEKTKLTFSGYSSHDEFRLSGDSTYQWDNLLSTLKLDHVFSSKLNSSFLLGYGSYGYEVFDKNPVTGFNLSYKITYPSFKADFHYQGGAHKLSFGFQSTYYGFDPGRLDPIGPTSNVKPIQIEKQQSLESGIYLGDGFTISEKFFLDGGVRFSTFTAMGPAHVNIYKPDQPLETLNLIDTLVFKSGEKIKTYYGVEPRASFRFTINQNSSIKIGYNRIYQYLQLVTNTAAITPIDIWQPSGYYFKPQMADQFSIGYFRNFKEKMYETFVEVYHKDISNVLDFKDGAQLILNSQLETDLIQGKGRAYGIETQVAKNLGRLTGSLNYTYSRSLRTIKGLTESESINKGNEYASNYDQPHIFNLNWKYGISKRYFFTGSFTYRTGRPVTTPVSAFIIDNLSIANFSERNQFRIPDYHRLDIAMVIEGNHKRKKFWDGTWTVSIYNVYARKNPYSIFFKEVDSGVLRPYRLAIIGTALPSVSYAFKF